MSSDFWHALGLFVLAAGAQLEFSKAAEVETEYVTTTTMQRWLLLSCFYSCVDCQVAFGGTSSPTSSSTPPPPPPRLAHLVVTAWFMLTATLKVREKNGRRGGE
jgi:hypothetical protein